MTNYTEPRGRVPCLNMPICVPGKSTQAFAGLKPNIRQSMGQLSGTLMQFGIITAANVTFNRIRDDFLLTMPSRRVIQNVDKIGW